MESISEKGLGLIERARGVSLRQTRLIKPDDLELVRQLDDLEVDL